MNYKKMGGRIKYEGQLTAFAELTRSEAQKVVWNLGDRRLEIACRIWTILVLLITSGCASRDRLANCSDLPPTKENVFEPWGFSADHLLPKAAFRVDLRNAR